jgi:hypothetical protein
MPIRVSDCGTQCLCAKLAGRRAGGHGSSPEPAAEQFVRQSFGALWPERRVARRMQPLENEPLRSRGTRTMRQRRHSRRSLSPKPACNCRAQTGDRVHAAFFNDFQNGQNIATAGWIRGWQPGLCLPCQLLLVCNSRRNRGRIKGPWHSPQLRCALAESRRRGSAWIGRRIRGLCEWLPRPPGAGDSQCHRSGRLRRSVYAAPGLARSDATGVAAANAAQIAVIAVLELPAGQC